MRLTAAYARVSSDRQEKDQTIDSQLEALHRGAAERNLRLTEDLIFVDNGFSGARLDRPGLDRLRDQASEGTCTTLLVSAPDRLARHFAYQPILLEGAIPRLILIQRNGGWCQDCWVWVIKELRAGGMSLRRIAEEVRARHGIKLLYMTVQAVVRP